MNRRVLGGLAAETLPPKTIPVALRVRRAPASGNELVIFVFCIAGGRSQQCLGPLW